MFKSIKKFFGFGDSAATEVSVQEVPYKVEAAPVVAVVVEAAITPAAPAVDVIAKPKAPRKPAAKKAPTAAKKPAAPKAVK